MDMNFTDAVKKCFANYININGRARRREYWYFVLFVFICSLIVATVANRLDFDMLVKLWQIFIFLPSLAVSIRRLHDIGKSGLFYLVSFIPLVGQILMIYWACKDSQPGNNVYGPNPKEPYFF